LPTDHLSETPLSLAATDSKKLRAARLSLVVTLILIVAKVTTGILTGSLALLSLASESAFDFLAVLFTFVSVRISSLPPDEDHPYGHGKFDSLSGLFQSIALLALSVWIFFEGLHRVQSPEHVTLDINIYTFIILIGSFFLDMWRARVLRAVAHESHSQALGADALHFLADALSVIIVAVGISIAHFFGVPSADAFAAMAVALFVGYQSIRLGKESADILMDRMPQREEYPIIKKIIEESDGIVGLQNLRMRRSSSVLFIDAVVNIRRVLPYAAIGHILSELEARIRDKEPHAEINLQWLPVKTENESPFETIKLVTSEFGILPHNIELSRDEKGQLTLDLHIEFPPGSSFEEAHAKSDEVEREIKRQLPQINTVITHLEVERSDLSVTNVRDITASRADLVSEVEKMVVSTSPNIIRIKKITLFESVVQRELKLAVTVELRKDLSLSEAHDSVTNAERDLREKFPELHRIVIHTEPK
jgi:cation diffusion facilitator family transporter